MSVGNISTLRRRSPPRWPATPDVICQNRTPLPRNPRRADATAVSDDHGRRMHNQEIGTFARKSLEAGIELFWNLLQDLHRFQSLAEARWIIGEFIARCNTEWLAEQLGHQTPAAARATAMAA